MNNERYERQVVMDSIGEEGQHALTAAKVLIVGLGGLGSPVVQYCAAAGVGTLGLCDSDTVSLSNLQRQVLYKTAEIGREKTEVSQQYVAALNPEVKTNVYKEHITSDNVDSIIAGYDIIVDATDNFETTFVLHDAAYAAEKWFVHAGVSDLSGQMMVVKKGSACLRCLFPEMPKETVKGMRPVLGTSVGIVGQLQAMETIKCVLFTDDVLLGNVLFIDTQKTTFKTVSVSRRAGCQCCGMQ